MYIFYIYVYFFIYIFVYLYYQNFFGLAQFSTNPLKSRDSYSRRVNQEYFHSRPNVRQAHVRPEVQAKYTLGVRMA